MTVAYEKFIQQNIIFSTSSLISYGGYWAYLRGEVGSEDKETRKKDAPEGLHLLDKLLFASTVDNFNSYLADVLVEIIETDHRPIAGKKFDVKAAFETDNIEDLRKNILEKFVLDLGYQNIDDLADFLRKSFGLKTLDYWLTRARIGRYIQIRNAITHNRGFVNKTFLFRSKSKMDKLSMPVFCPAPLSSAKYMSWLAEKIENEIEAKFFSK